MKDRIKPILIKDNITMKEAMRIIETAPQNESCPSPAGIVLIVDEENRLLGGVTDADIRKAILGGYSLDTPVYEIMRKKPLTVNTKNSPEEMMKKIFDEAKIKNIAGHKLDKITVVDDENKVIDVISFFELWKNTDMKMREVCIVGLGYVGLTLALVLSGVGFKVVGIDKNEEVISKLKKGEPHIHEVGLPSLLKYHINKNFFVDTKLDRPSGEVYIITVNTPVDENTGLTITSYLESALQSISKVLKQNDLVILRSTVPVGTCREIAIPELEKGSGLVAGKDFFLAFAPERTIEGKAIEELKSLPQIVGGLDKKSTELASKFFNTITNFIVPVSSLEVAEMVKLLNNTFRDLSFAYANEIAQICNGFNINSFEVINAANKGYPRDKIPTPSPGVGGACLTKDPYILTNSAKKVGLDIKLPIAGRKINDEMMKFVVSRVDRFISESNKQKPRHKVFVVGLAFKGHPETSDMRFSTAVKITKLLDEKYDVCVYDPVVSEDEIRKIGFNPVSMKKGFDNADCVLILNNHPSFRNMDIHGLANLTDKPSFLFDGWDMLSKDTIDNIDGITYGTFGL